MTLCAVATILLALGRGSVRYESKSPTGFSPNECFLVPHRTQSTPSSSHSYREQTCCTQTRLGTCNLATCVYSVFCVVSKSWNTYSTLLPAGGSASHITQVIDYFILLTVVAETFITFVIVVRDAPSTRLATPLSFAHCFLVRSCRLWFAKHVRLLKYLLHSAQEWRAWEN